MTREQKIEAFKMRLDGITFQEIADKFGLSKQRVQEILIGIVSSKSFDGKVNHYKFPNLIRWINENGLSIKDFGDKVLVHNANRTNIYNKLLGITKFRMDEIKTILEMTSMTFDKAFSLEVSLDE